MRWTVITVTFNSAATLTRFWTERIPDDVQWIVVDNASTDGSAETARSLGAHVIELDANVGFAKANNVALRATAGDFVAFVNPDVAVDWSSLDQLAEDVADRQALVAPQLVDTDGQVQPNGRGLPHLVDKFAHRGVRLPGHRVQAYLPSAAADLTPVAWTMGAALCGRREQFEALGGWDEGYFIYYEDHEIGLRAWTRGVPVLVDSRVRWVHGWARETTAANRTAWKHELRSAWRFYRNYPELLLPTRRLASRRPYAVHMRRYDG
jgi:GT2 family glycosyltransferase